MTEAEIEAKAEEIAKERCRENMCYGNCNVHKNHHCGYWHYNYECALKGIKWGMEHAIEWHDLRKDPNDLPKLESKGFSWSITVANQLGEACHYNYSKSCWETPYVTEIEGVVKWCEFPQYKDKE